MFATSQFRPAWWLKNSHLQTITAKWFKRHQHINTETETIELPDGDFIDIDWTEKPTNDNKKPIVVILHGLEGSKTVTTPKECCLQYRRKTGLVC